MFGGSRDCKTCAGKDLDPLYEPEAEDAKFLC